MKAFNHHDIGEQTHEYDKINVVVAVDYDDNILNNLRQVSPRLQIEKHYPNVPKRAWKNAEILCTQKHRAHAGAST